VPRSRDGHDLAAPSAAQQMTTRTRIEHLMHACGGLREAADVLGTTTATLARWRAGHAAPDPHDLQVLVDLDWLVGRLVLRAAPPAAVVAWLRAPCPALDGAHPLELVRTGGVATVVAALEAD